MENDGITSWHTRFRKNKEMNNSITFLPPNLTCMQKTLADMLID